VRHPFPSRIAGFFPRLDLTTTMHSVLVSQWERENRAAKGENAARNPGSRPRYPAATRSRLFVAGVDHSIILRRRIVRAGAALAVRGRVLPVLKTPCGMYASLPSAAWSLGTIVWPRAPCFPTACP
jgi:hypothetical protein